MSKTNGNILARWQTTIEKAACSPLEFYDRVECSLLDCELPDLRVLRITRNEGGWFSPKRIYLRIQYQRLYFDVSAFVIGRSLIVSWWLHKQSLSVADLLAEIPGFSFLLEKIIRAATYYAVDFTEHFQRTVHKAVLQVVDNVTEQTGFAPLLEEARQPVWEEVW